jgi:sulfur-carrier protein
LACLPGSRHHGGMARVAFTANLERHLACPVQSAPGDCVRAVLDNVFAAHPRLRSYLLDDQGRVRRHVSIYVNADHIADRDRLSDPVNDDDEVFVFQALSGG